MFMAAMLTMKAAKVEKTVQIKVGTQTRSYLLYVPANAKSTGAPLVFSLHGTSGHSSDKQPFDTSVADKQGCIVVYPQGEDMTFPAFGNAVLPGWHSTGVWTKDIDFFLAIIEDVASKYKVDRQRIYCCGFSNGGMMAYTVANVASDVFAAFASISGFPLNEFHLHHTSARPYPFLHIHGKADDFVKYSLVPRIVDNTVARNGCNPVPEVKTVSGKYRKNVYAATEGSFPYVYYEIDGMGHSPNTGNTEDGNSSTTMWKFMSQYKLDDPRDSTLKWRPNIDVEGWEPKSHGWNNFSTTAVTLLSFGKDQKTDANQNVYNSLQFETGKYKLCFRAEGTGSTVKVLIQKLTGTKTKVLNISDVPVGQDIVLPFATTGGWAEYKLQVTHTSGDGEVSFKNMGIYSMTDEEYDEATALQAPVSSQDAEVAVRYNLQGVRTSPSAKGIVIEKQANGQVKKVLR